MTDIKHIGAILDIQWRPCGGYNECETCKITMHKYVATFYCRCGLQRYRVWRFLTRLFRVRSIYSLTHDQ